MFESVFVIFSVFWALFLSIVFCWVLTSIFHGFGLHFDTTFLYCFGFVATSGFSDFWQPFHSKTRFLQVQGCQIYYMFNMFCWLRFKFVFYRILWPFWSHLGLHLAPFFRKKPFRKSLQKKGASIWKRVTMGGSRGSQRGRLLLFFIKADASRARCLDNNNNKVKLNSIQIELRSGWGLAEVWLELEFLLELASIAKQIQNNSRNWKGLRSMKMVNVNISKAHCWWSDTPTGPRPGEFV